MSLEFVEGFDHYTSQTNHQRKWDTTSALTHVVTGRFGGSASAINSGDSPMYVSSPQLSSVSTRAVGFAYQVNGTGFNGNAFIQFLDSGSVQVDVRITAAGAIQLTRNGAVLATSATGQFTGGGTWYYVEFKATIHSSAGAVDFRINGVSVVSASGANTQATGNANMNGIKLLGVTANPNNNAFDDLYVLNSSGSSNNNFLGECRVYTDLPNADGATVAWTPDTGSTHFSRVNESNPNDDTSYVASANVGDKEQFAFASISPTGVIAGVQITLTARKDDAGTRQIAESCRSGGTDYTGSGTFTLASTYGMSREIRELNPATSAVWSNSEVNAAQFGAKVVA